MGERGDPSLLQRKLSNRAGHRTPHTYKDVTIRKKRGRWRKRMVLKGKEKKITTFKLARGEAGYSANTRQPR